MNLESPAEEGSAATETGSVESRAVAGAPYPHRETPKDASGCRNADRVPPVPIGPVRKSVAPSEPADDHPADPPADPDQQ